MNRHLFLAAAWIGALAVVWVGSGFLGTNSLALVVTLIIGGTYAIGVLEIREFRRATSTLAAALDAIPEPVSNLGEWLDRLHPSLQNAVRLRIEGERIGLPGPTLTPYLVGLLVMLGMLGTFLGMVVTLNGAVFALEGTSDLATIRAALTTPIKGLGLAFGTSVAGVAASAMLGLISALSRRERLHAAQLLDTNIATVLRSFSLTHQRQETFKALQAQTQALPEVVQQLQAMMLQLERGNQQLAERLINNQESFHRTVTATYGELACAVEKSLKDSLKESAYVAGESIKPVVEAAMTRISSDAASMHEKMINVTQSRLDALSDRVGETATRVIERSAESALAQQQQVCSTLNMTALGITGQLETVSRRMLDEIVRLTSQAEESMQSRIASDANWEKHHSARMEQLVSVWRTELATLKDEEAQRGNAAVERLGELQTAVASHLTVLGAALEEPLTRLIETASEAPRAAAELIEQLRREMTNSMARDNVVLEERGRIMVTLNSLLDAINHASAEQRGVIDSLVASSAELLERIGNQFVEQVGNESIKMSDIAAHVTSSAVEVSSLGESFGFAVQLFNEANEKLIASLQRIEGSLDKSMARSDEQLAYYVAQAREIIDLSIMSQKEVVGDLRQLADTQMVLAGAAS